MVSGTDKNTRMLSLYHQLLTGKKVNKQAFCIENDINERSFDRDIEDIRLFLCDKHPYCELNYNRLENGYYLTHVLGQELSSEVSLYISNILLSQKMIRKDEMEEVLKGLIGVTDSTRCKEVYEFIKDQAKLERSWPKRAILKMHWDLEHAIKNHNQIEMEYETRENKLVLRQVKPVQLHAENGFVYLIAYMVDKQYDNPAYFRLDRISRFKIINESFSPELIKKYMNKENNVDRFSMLAGDEISVIVQVQDGMERTIKDVFPKSVAIEGDSENALFRIETYKQGFISWILGQEGRVIIVEPDKLKMDVMSKLKEMINKYERK